MTETYFIAILGVYSGAVVLGITLGGIIGLTVLLFRHQRSKAYNLNVE